MCDVSFFTYSMKTKNHIFCTIILLLNDNQKISYLKYHSFISLYNTNISKSKQNSNELCFIYINIMLFHLIYLEF